MSRVTVTGLSVHTSPILIGAIKPGQVFTGRIGNYPNRLFKKYYERVIALDDNDGQAIWSGAAEIEEFRPVDEIQINVIK